MTVVARYSSLWITACVGLAGCPPEPASCLPGDSPTLQIGTGEDHFVSIPASGEVELIQGPQGGYHTLIGLEATYLDASALMLGEMSATIEGDAGATSTPWLQMACNPRTETLQAFGSLLIWDVDFDPETELPAPEDLYGRSATVSVEVRDVAGTVVSDEIDIVIVEEGTR